MKASKIAKTLTDAGFVVTQTSNAITVGLQNRAIDTQEVRAALNYFNCRMVRSEGNVVILV